MKDKIKTDIEGPTTNMETAEDILGQKSDRNLINGTATEGAATGRERYTLEDAYIELGGSSVGIFQLVHSFVCVLMFNGS